MRALLLVLLPALACGVQVPPALSDADTALQPRVDSLRAMVAARAAMVVEARWNARASFVAAGEADAALEQLQRMVEASQQSAGELQTMLDGEGKRREALTAAGAEWDRVKKDLASEAEDLRAQADDPAFGKVVRRAMERAGEQLGAEPQSVASLAALADAGAETLAQDALALQNAATSRGVPKLVLLWLGALAVLASSVGAARFAARFRAALGARQHLLIAHFGNAALLALGAALRVVAGVDLAAALVADGRDPVLRVLALVAVLGQCAFLLACASQLIAQARTTHGRLAALLHLGLFSAGVAHLFSAGIPSVRAGATAPGLYGLYLALTLSLVYLLVWEDVAGDKGAIPVDVRGAARVARDEARTSLRSLRDGLVGPPGEGGYASALAPALEATGRRFSASRRGSSRALAAAASPVSAVFDWIETRLSGKGPGGDAE